MNKISAILLSAGLGTRLKPFTNNWPKCLMPIGKYPLLEYWLSILKKNRVQQVIVNTHHHSKLVKKFLRRKRFKDWVDILHEDELLGTAGTLRKLERKIKYSTIMVIHADNWTNFNFKSFLNYHIYHRPYYCNITMMTFRTEDPLSAGIIEKDKNGVVSSFHEKVKNPPGNLANAAIYLMEREVLEFISINKKINDFSNDLIPKFIGRIATWENKGFHRDIGKLENLIISQDDIKPKLFWKFKDIWYQDFQINPIHKKIKQLKF